MRRRSGGGARTPMDDHHHNHKEKTLVVAAAAAGAGAGTAVWRNSGDVYTGRPREGRIDGAGRRRRENTGAMWKNMYGFGTAATTTTDMNRGEHVWCAASSAPANEIGEEEDSKSASASSSSSSREAGGVAPGTVRPFAFGEMLREGEVTIPNADDYLEVPNLRAHLRPRESPLKAGEMSHLLGHEGFVSDDDRVRLQALAFGSEQSAGASCVNGMSIDGVCIPLPQWGLRSGPRETVYFDASDVKVAIVTCGGLCPGLNDVVHGLVETLFKEYGLKKGQVLGIRYGFRGFYEGAEPIELCPRTVQGIHLTGGTILGTTRGGSDTDKIVNSIRDRGINMVFVIGGNGGNAGANAIHEECVRREMHVSVVGVPKSIDNDILLIDRCFGFDTAVEEAQRAIAAAYVEARSAYNGIGIVKLMGRQSGFIAALSTLSFQEVDLCLIPEVPFSMEGPNGVTAYANKVLEEKGYMIIVVAEGAGQDVLSENALGTDASGNPVLADIGLWLKKTLKSELKTLGRSSDIKYIDPSYMIRGVPSNPSDRIMCLVLAQGAVHGAFAGYSGITVGLVNTHYVYLPIPTIIQAPRTVDPVGRVWNRIVKTTGQPATWGADL